MAHPGLVAWAREAQRRMDEMAVGPVKRSSGSWVAVPPKPAPEDVTWCQIRGCDSPAVHHEPERLCPGHLENLWSWTKRSVSPKVDSGATLV